LESLLCTDFRIYTEEWNACIKNDNSWNLIKNLITAVFPQKNHFSSQKLISSIFKAAYNFIWSGHFWYIKNKKTKKQKKIHSSKTIKHICVFGIYLNGNAQFSGIYPVHSEVFVTNHHHFPSLMLKQLKPRRVRPPGMLRNCVNLWFHM